VLNVRWDGAIRVLLALAGLALLPVLWVGLVPPRGTAMALAVWDVLALAFLFRQVRAMRRGRVDGESEPDWLLPVRLMRLRYGALIVASATGLSSGLLIVTVDQREDWSLTLEAIRVLAALAAVLAWLILHTGYAMHYANIYFAHGKGMNFPGTQAPNFLDFAYFALTLGATFATSDVEVTNRRIRHAVIWHSVLSFFYNAAVLGLAIGAFTGK
jgi:hypothetical protein